ncbi:hypothetical protein [Mucilaginibacter sp. PAMB04168]
MSIFTHGNKRIKHAAQIAASSEMLGNSESFAAMQRSATGS